MLIVTGTISVAPLDVVGFTTDLVALTSATRRRDGNLSYHTAVLDADAGQILVMERWRDEAALAAHLRAADTTAFVARWGAQSKSEVRVYDVRDERLLASYEG